MAAIAYPASPVPAICLTPAPDMESPAPEPRSPFACLSPQIVDEDDGFRSALLTPPLLSPGRSLSPLRPTDAPVPGQGLQRERFEALLKTSRDRNAMVGARKGHDLRKEIALKAHKTKQTERRALFLSKLQAPPSPSAALLPKTPPESPAILHYSLPSPGLTSPLALYEALAEQPTDKRAGWVEQVDFRLPEGQRVKKATRPSAPARAHKGLPSLADIACRMSAQGHPPMPVVVVLPPTDDPVGKPARRLPAFLQKERPGAAPAPVSAPTPAPAAAAEPPKRRALLAIGRLQAPVAAAPISVVKAEAEPTLAVPAACASPRSPGAPQPPSVTVRTTVVPRTSRASPVELSESNLVEFNSRARTTKHMLSALRRRTSDPDTMGALIAGSPASPTRPRLGGEGEDDKGMRRRSSPAELPRRERTGFGHEVLALPGAF